MKPRPINEQVRDARERAGLTQQELAKLCGIKSQSVISRIEDGTHAARVDTLQRIAEALRVQFVVGWQG